MRAIARVLAGTAMIVGCASPSEDDGVAATNDAITEAENHDFHPRNECLVDPETAFYTAEIDLSDRANPRYRIRHYGESRNIGKQNIHLVLRDGSVWESPDNLVSHPSSLDLNGLDVNDGEVVLRRMAEASARDPWEPLPVPKEFLDKAFRVTKDRVYNLESWVAILNYPWYSLQADPVCHQDFYYASPSSP